MNRLFIYLSTLFLAPCTALVAQEEMNELVIPPSIFSSTNHTDAPQSKESDGNEDYQRGIDLIEDPKWRIFQTFEAKVRILNKRSDKVQTITLTPYLSISFDDISVTARTCAESTEKHNENISTFIDVVDHEYETLFSGWMFNKSKEVTSIEHPIYDVQLINCKYKKRKATPKI